MYLLYSTYRIMLLAVSKRVALLQKKHNWDRTERNIQLSQEELDA